MRADLRHPHEVSPATVTPRMFWSSTGADEVFRGLTRVCHHAGWPPGGSPRSARFTARGWQVVYAEAQTT
jgi:hypothetical protein